MTIKLTQFEPNWGIPNISPFCLKVETFLKMAKIPYQNIYDFDIRKAPKKRFPYIEIEGKKIADSEFIIDLIQEKEKVDLDAHLNQKERAISEAFKSLLEEDLISCMLYSRWVDKRYFPTIKTDLFGSLPIPLRWIIPKIAQKNVKKRLNFGGILSHNEEEIYQIGIKHIQSVANFLADKPYFMGGKPSRIDATAFAFIVNCTHSKIETPLQKEALKHENLKVYSKRFLEMYYSDIAL